MKIKSKCVPSNQKILDTKPHNMEVLHEHSLYTVVLHSNLNSRMWAVEAKINCHERNKWCAKHAINICNTAWLKWSFIVTKSSLTRPVASFSTFQTMPFGTVVSSETTPSKVKGWMLHTYTVTIFCHTSFSLWQLTNKPKFYPPKKDLWLSKIL